MNNPSKENPDDRPQPPQRMNSEERSNEDERHCLHFYENDQHYAHEGPHEIASWREVVSLRSALAAALARIAAVEAELARADAILRDYMRIGTVEHFAVLAASPTPTGPERCPECNHEPGCWCPETPTPHGCRTCLATPTGPEPARCGEFNPGTRSWYRCTEPQGHDGDHVVQRPGFSSVYARWPGPATPEPTEETP